MKQITIIGTNEIGKNAIRQHYEETKKMKFKERMLWKAIGKQEIISEDPYTLCISFKNIRLLANPFFLDSLTYEMRKALKENGAEIDKDYCIEVK